MMTGAKNRWYKPLVWCVVISATLGITAMVIWFAIGPVKVTFSSSEPLWPRIATLIALLAGFSFMGCLVFGAMWLYEYFKASAKVGA